MKPVAKGDPIPFLCGPCLESGKRQQLIVTHPTSGALDADRHDGIAGPYWLYRCPACKYAEIHLRLWREGVA